MSSTLPSSSARRAVIADKPWRVHRRPVSYRESTCLDNSPLAGGGGVKPGILSPCSSELPSSRLLLRILSGGVWCRSRHAAGPEVASISVTAEPDPDHLGGVLPRRPRGRSRRLASMPSATPRSQTAASSLRAPLDVQVPIHMHQGADGHAVSSTLRDDGRPKGAELTTSAVLNANPGRLFDVSPDDVVSPAAAVPRVRLVQHPGHLRAFGCTIR